jgi:hypothetical protein
LDEGRALIGGDCRGVSDFRKLLDDRDVQGASALQPIPTRRLNWTGTCSSVRPLPGPTIRTEAFIISVGSGITPAAR